jgi:Cu-Zn family superoxide dismutase
MKLNEAWLFVAVLALGCGRNPTALHAEGEFVGVQGFDGVEGQAKLEETPRGVKILVWLENAPPGPKGVHIHQKGDCSDPLMASMGQHFAPHREPHGLPGAATHHPGDFGNIRIRDDGKGVLELTTDGGNLSPDDPMSFANRAIIVHESEDKSTEPSGDAGKPLACAVIRSG